MFKKVLCAAFLLAPSFGCGSQDTILPTTPFTPEQIEKIKAEDQSIENEESQGSNQKRAKNKK